MSAAQAEAKASATQPLPPHVIAPPSDEPYQAWYGAHIQRSMTLLATSSKEFHRPVKILLYGQSIVGSYSFTKFLSDYFQREFPYAAIHIENRAIGGFTADRLVRTATHDLYPYYPDLLIFHVYGGQQNGDLERIISNVRRYTTSDIVLFNDHRQRDQDITDASAKYIRYLAAKYDCELVDVSQEWPRYLREHALEPASLLRDAVHPNPDGYALLTELIERHLKYNPIYTTKWEETVRTYEAKRPLTEDINDEISLKGNGWIMGDAGAIGTNAGDTLHLEFEGNRVDIIAAHEKQMSHLGSARVLIDGKPPSQEPTTSAITLPSAAPGGWFPVVRRISHSAALLPEDWTLRITRIDPDGKDIEFDVIGSKTGPDGSGSSLKHFQSDSGRVIIEPSDWMLAESMKTFKQGAPPKGYEIHWKAIPTCQDVYQATSTPDPATVYETTVYQSLRNGRHTLDIQLNGDGNVPIQAIDVYHPPLH